MKRFTIWLLVLVTLPTTVLAIDALLPREEVIAERQLFYASAYKHADRRLTVAVVLGTAALVGVGGYLVWSHLQSKPAETGRLDVSSAGSASSPVAKSAKQKKRKSAVPAVAGGAEPVAEKDSKQSLPLWEQVKILSVAPIVASVTYALYQSIQGVCQRLLGQKVSAAFNADTIFKQSYTSYVVALLSARSSAWLAKMCGTVGDAQYASFNEYVVALESFIGATRARIAMVTSDERVSLMPVEQILQELAKRAAATAEQLNTHTNDSEAFAKQLFSLSQLSAELDQSCAQYFK